MRCMKGLLCLALGLCVLLVAVSRVPLGDAHWDAPIYLYQAKRFAETQLLVDIAHSAEHIAAQVAGASPAFMLAYLPYAGSGQARTHTPRRFVLAGAAVLLCYLVYAFAFHPLVDPRYYLQFAASLSQRVRGGVPALNLVFVVGGLLWVGALLALRRITVSPVMLISAPGVGQEHLNLIRLFGPVYPASACRAAPAQRRTLHLRRPHEALLPEAVERYRSDAFVLEEIVVRAEPVSHPNPYPNSHLEILQ